MPTDFIPPTVHDFLLRIFPDGTSWPIPDGPRKKKPSIKSAPIFPTDVFAAASLLIFRSGAVSRLVIGRPSGAMPAALKTAFSAMDGASVAGIDLNNPDTLEQFRKAGKRWARTLPVPKIVRSLWKELINDGSAPVHHLPKLGEPFPSWWTTAMALMIISDEACEGLGYAAAVDFRSNWVSAMVLLAVQRLNEKAYAALRGSSHTAIVSEDLPSLCFLADPDVVCVQPKVRTPSVGCTLRSYSQNVAMLPPRGIVSTGWQNPPQRLRSEDSSALNILIVPYPFRLRASWFSGTAATASSKSAADDVNRQKWGWFDLEQKWLPSATRLVEFTQALISEAEKDVGTIHGVLFPEYAMTWKLFESIKNAVLKNFPNLEFLVSGSSSNCVGEPGNFVLSAVFLDVPVSNETEGVPRERAALVSSRWKHHRWRLDDPQISNYALGSALDPRTLWWEGISLGPRKVDFTVFRTSSAFTTLICEDLARSDPCHSVLRDVGPNLVFVMLMDGPQLKDRWSARYSTTLADDPGCSVLTYTSLALIERSNRSGIYSPSDVIGLWKDDTGKAIEVKCPNGHHGVVLSLSAARVSEYTLDGRYAHGARAWRFHSHHPVKIRTSSDKLKAAIEEVMAEPD